MWPQVGQYPVAGTQVLQYPVTPGQMLGDTSAYSCMNSGYAGYGGVGPIMPPYQQQMPIVQSGYGYGSPMGYGMSPYMAGGEAMMAGGVAGALPQWYGGQAMAPAMTSAMPMGGRLISSK